MIVLQFTQDGEGHCLHTEAIPLTELGTLQVERASRVEFNTATQKWEVTLLDNPAQIAYSDQSRANCLKWEVETLNRRLLMK